MTTAQQRQALGRFGETAAARHLAEQGMVLLERNWRCEVGEIDLVLRDGRVLVACEVKTRTSAAFGSPLEAVTPVKAHRLQVLAARWAEARGLRAPEMRVDVVGVLVHGTTVVTLEHVRGVCG